MFCNNLREIRKYDAAKKIETFGFCPEPEVCRTVSAIISSNEETRENLRREGE